MSRGTRFLQSSLIGIGSLAIAIGIAIVLYATLVLKPRLNVLNEQVQQTLTTLEATTQVLDHSSSFFNSFLDALQSGSQLTQKLPATLISLNGTLLQSSALLNAAGNTAEKAQHGITGLILPHNALGIDDEYLRKTASQLRILAGMTLVLERSFSNLAKHTSDISSQVTNLKSQIGPLTQNLEENRARIHQIQGALHSLDLPVQVVLLAWGIAGIYFVFGAFSLVLSIIYANSVQSNVPKIPMNSNRNIKQEAA